MHSHLSAQSAVEFFTLLTKCKVCLPYLTLGMLSIVWPFYFLCLNLSTLSAWYECNLSMWVFSGMGWGLANLILAKYPQGSVIVYSVVPSFVICSLSCYLLNQQWILGCFHFWAPDYCCEHVYTSIPDPPLQL